MTFKPQDKSERSRIATSLDETLFVEAGAGTGKTTSLVQRILELVGSGATTLDRVAAITFTEAAAAELRDRIRSELEKAAANAKLSAEKRQLCRQGVEQLDNAAIQTLHSFAAALLQERPLEAGLPPSFDTMDAIESELDFDKAWTEWIDAALDDPELQPHFLVALSLGLKINQLRGVAVKFHENYDLLAHEEFILPQRGKARKGGEDNTSSVSFVIRRLLDAAPEMARLCQFSRLGSDDALYAHTQAKLASIRQFEGMDVASHNTLRLLLRLLPLRQSNGTERNWNTDAVSGVNACKMLKALLQELNAEGTDAIAQTRSAVLMSLLVPLKAFALDYAAQRKAQGRVSFHDMLVWARDMLRDSISARDHFRRRFTHLLIDEAQDTDFIQAEIALYLAEHVPPDTPDRDRQKNWQDITPQEGKLFVVGDPKQSIYRFRRADVGQMRRLQARMGGETLRLVQNFRSQRPVVEWVNTLFDKWMAAEAGASQAEYTPIRHRWTANTGHPAAPRVWAIGDEVEGKADDVRRVEAPAIAMLLHQIVGEKWQILDRAATESEDKERYKDATYSDICILMPSRTALRTLELALADANVPYRLEGASLFFNTQEVRDMLNCLRAIDDPSDEIAIVAALRSPAFACTDVELLQFHQKHRTFNYLHQHPGYSSVGKVAYALAVLRDAHDRRMWTTTAALIDGFIRERQLMEAAMSERRSREQWRRYRFLVEQARAFAAAGGNGLRAFLQWMQRQDEEGARISETPVPETDEDAVRIMTVHAAKGLEFPVVILTGLNNDRSRSTRRNTVIFDGGNVEVGVGSEKNRFGTQGYEEASASDKALEAEEHVRLLYVAATRARDHLVLSMHRQNNSNTSLDSTRIAELLAEHDDLWERVELRPEYQYQAPAARATEQPPHFDSAAHTVETRAEWQGKRDAVLAAQSKPASVAATSIAEVLKDESDANIGVDDMQSSRRGRGGAPLGRAVHAVLQTIDLKTGKDIRDTARAQATAEGIPQLQDEIAALARAAVDSDIVRRAVASGRYWREAHIAAPIGEGVLEGFIDLLFEEDGELVVVDYKTDAIDEKSAEHIADSRYREQAGSYALITEHATGKRVKDVIFLFLRPRQEERLHNLEALKVNAKSAAEHYLQRQQA